MKTVELISKQLDPATNQINLTPASFRAIARQLEEQEITAVNFALGVDLLEQEGRKVCSKCAGPVDRRRRSGEPYYWQTCRECYGQFQNWLTRLASEQN